MNTFGKRFALSSFGEVVDMFDKYKDSDIINITIADGLSGTYQSACAAKEMSENRERCPFFRDI